MCLKFEIVRLIFKFNMMIVSDSGKNILIKIFMIFFLKYL